jgi:hypothetical protein
MRSTARDSGTSLGTIIATHILRLEAAMLTDAPAGESPADGIV